VVKSRHIDHFQTRNMNRREVFSWLGAIPFLGVGALEASAKKQKQPKRVLRVAHLTDTHLTDTRNAVKNYTTCLHHVQSLKEEVDLILDGGDTIMDSLGVKEKAKVDAQWKLWENTYGQGSDLDIVHCVGNHDVWAGAEKTDPLYGKKYVQDRLQMDSPYYSFDRAGWHFIVLDSTHPVNGGWYTAKLDEAQMDWLRQDLENTNKETPILVLSHIPILTATGFYPDNVKEGNWTVPGSWMHTDFQEIQKLFMAHGNVRACLSGHMHLLDYVIYNGITYMCNGAVSGNWWGDPMYYETRAGYAVINLYADGSFDREWYEYEWV